MSFFLDQDGLASVKRKRRQRTFSAVTLQQQYEIRRSEEVRSRTLSPKRKKAHRSIRDLIYDAQVQKQGARPSPFCTPSTPYVPSIPRLVIHPLHLDEAPSSKTRPTDNSWSSELQDIWIEHVSRSSVVSNVASCGTIDNHETISSGESTVVDDDHHDSICTSSSWSSAESGKSIPIKLDQRSPYRQAVREYEYQFNPLGYSCDQCEIQPISELTLDAHHQHAIVETYKDSLSGIALRDHFSASTIALPALKQHGLWSKSTQTNSVIGLWQSPHRRSSSPVQRSDKLLPSSDGFPFCLEGSHAEFGPVPASIRASRKKLFPSHIPQADFTPGRTKLTSISSPVTNSMRLRHSKSHIARRVQPKVHDYASSPVKRPIKVDFSRDEHFFEPHTLQASTSKERDWESGLVERFSAWGSKSRNVKKLARISSNTSPFSPKARLPNKLTPKLQPLTPIATSPFASIREDIPGIIASLRTTPPSTLKISRSVTPFSVHYRNFSNGLTRPSLYH